MAAGSRPSDWTCAIHHRTDGLLPGLRGTIYIYIYKWQKGSSEGKGKSGQVRQILSQTDEETPSRCQKSGA
jgi:hypothetical protein